MIKRCTIEKKEQFKRQKNNNIEHEKARKRNVTQRVKINW